MSSKQNVELSTGETALDSLLGGGLQAGDNVVWVGDNNDLHEQLETAFLQEPNTQPTLVLLADRTTSRPLPANVEVIDGRPGQPYADPVALEREILNRGSDPAARIVIRDLDTLVSRLGSKKAMGFFLRTCPRLFDRGSIAYWRASRDGSSGILESVQRVTQCVIDHTGGRLRVLKAEGRPRVTGRIFDVEIENGTLAMTEVRALSRLADGLRRIRVSRRLTQTDIARLAEVSPSAISQVEAGQRGLNLDTLLTLGAALNVSIDDLLSYHPDPGYVLARRDRIPARRGLVPLLDDPEAGLRSYLVVLGPGETGEPGSVHKGAELILVGTGVVQILLNEETPVLRAGDALLVTTDAIHGWRNLLPETARLFWIVRD